MAAASVHYQKATRAPLVLAAGSLLLVSLTVAAEAPKSPPACAGLEAGPQRTVTRVIDGETVALDDGSELRLIGALAPRALDAGAEPGTWPMEVAATAELRALAIGKSIDIAFGGERTDRYGRLQGHAFIQDGEQRRWLQGHLLEQGLARAYTMTGNRACADALLASERLARDAHRGLWAEAAYHVRPAARPQALRRYRTTFQIIEGRIARVAQVRGTIYLNFDANRRRGFSVSLRRGDAALLGDYARNAKGLEDRSVRVRGWIEDRNGATIDLSAGGQIEVIDEAKAGAVDIDAPTAGAPR